MVNELAAYVERGAWTKAVMVTGDPVTCSMGLQVVTDRDVWGQPSP
jgi:hypothetical protein